MATNGHAGRKEAVEGVGGRLRKRRLELGHTLRAVAERAGLGRFGGNQLSGYEMGSRTPGLHSFVSLCRALGTHPNAMLGMGPRNGNGHGGPHA